MGIFLIQDEDGANFLWDPDGMYIAIRTALRWIAVMDYTHRFVDEGDWFMPTVENVTTDWASVNQRRDTDCNAYWPNAELQVRTDAPSAFGSLIGLVEEGLSAQAQYWSIRRDAQHRSMRNISNNVADWERAVETATLIRDGSATILVVVGSIATAGGGAAAAAAGMTGVSSGTATATVAAGSLMRGAFTYQDTGNIGAAAINATGSFVTGVIGVGSNAVALNALEEGAILVIGSAAGGAATGAQALAEGRSMRDAAIQSLVATGGGVVSGLVGARLDGAGFWVETAVNTAMDMASGAATNAATPTAQVPVPSTLGRIDFAAVPEGRAEDFVRATALRPI